MTQSHLTLTPFSKFNLHSLILEAIKENGFNYCTPIQQKSLELTTNEKHVVAQAQTGTGKTMAFLIATFNHLLKQTHSNNKNQPRALILAPTRELVMQIFNDAQILANKTNLKIGVAFGGDGYDKQLQSFDVGVDVLVATTGRLIDYIKNKHIDLAKIEVMVLDEADRMFDLGFIRDVRWLFKQIPPANERLTMMFSATLSHEVCELAFEHMHEPEYIEIEPEQKIAFNIKEELFFPSNEDKLPLLQTLIEEEWPNKAIVFANTKITCEKIWRSLVADGHRVGLLSGDVAQKKRLSVLEKFTQGDYDILVATDVAARGLHISDVTHVFNYDLPDDAADYRHRIGRTGRAGNKGHSISFACERYAHNLTAIELAITHVIPVSQYDPSALLTDLPKPRINHNQFRKKPQKIYR